MTIDFRCPRCKATYQVDDNQAGEIYTCTSCDAQLRVPAAASTSSPFASPSSEWGEAGPMPGLGSPASLDSKPAEEPEQPWHSPYASPQTTSPPPIQRRSTQYFFRAANGLVGTLTVLFVLNALMDLLFVFLETAFLTVDVSVLGILDLGDGTVLSYFEVFYTLCGFLMLVVYLTTSIIYLVWVNRANKNARALGAVGMTFTPGWCVGWWFIPIAHLFKPYQAVREIYLASSPTATPTSWRVSPAPSLLGFWWATWIIGIILSNIEGRLAMQGDEDLLRASSVVGIIAGLVGIAAAFTAMQVVRQINQRQNRKAGAAK